MSNTNWKTLITKEMKRRKDSWKNLESSTLTKVTLTERFDDGYGTKEGCPFTVWTKDFVYFPVTYDGAEWVKSVPRNPDGTATEHVGGG